jgi:S1-C subfamily serine protease
LIKYGKVRRGWIGFLARENKLGSGEQAQIEIASVFKNSPAENAGLLSGDIIQKVENKNITSTSSLVSQIGQIPVGTKIMMQILRNEKEKNIELVLQEKEEFYQIKNTLDNITNKYGVNIDEDSIISKIFVTQVLPGPLSGNLKMGDVIVKINDQDCPTLEDFIVAYNRSDKKINLLEIERGTKKYEIKINNSRFYEDE